MHLRINDEHIRGRIMTGVYRKCLGDGDKLPVPFHTTDGWMYCVIYRPEFLQIISGLWMLIQGRILNHKVVKSYRTRKVKVLRAQNAAVDLDGRLLPKHFPLSRRAPGKDNAYHPQLIRITPPKERNIYSQSN